MAILKISTALVDLPHGNTVYIRTGAQELTIFSTTPHYRLGKLCDWDGWKAHLVSERQVTLREITLDLVERPR